MKHLLFLVAVVVLDIIDSPLSSCSCDRDNDFVQTVEQQQTPQEVQESVDLQK